MAKQLGPLRPGYSRVGDAAESQSRGTDFLGSAARVEDILAINLPPNVRQRTRFSKAGKRQRRYTLEIETEPVFHALESDELGRRNAEIIAEMAGENLRKAGRKAAEATQKWRAAALKRLRRGSSDRSAGSGSFGAQLKKRYSGGRIGYKEPQIPHDQYGIDSGRLADGMFARLNREGRMKGQRNTWTVNVPANRLNKEQWQGDQGLFMAWLKEFRDMVNLAAIVTSNRFEAATQEGLAAVIGTLQSAQWRKRRQLFRQQWKVVQGGARLLAVI